MIETNLESLELRLMSYSNSIINLLIESPEQERGKIVLDFLVGLGFKVFTNNNYVHCFCRYYSFSFDVWGSTLKLHVTEQGIEKTYNGASDIVTKLIKLTKYLEN